MVVLREVGAVLFVAAIGCAFSSSVVISHMVEDINRASKEEENAFWGSRGNIGRIKGRYRALFPGGRRADQLSRLMLTAAALFLGGVALIFGSAFVRP
jgi:hypothetical protein